MHEAMAQGAISYMLKPVAREQLETAIRSLERRLEGRLRRVLIVEDDPILRDQLARARVVVRLDAAEHLAHGLGGKVLRGRHSHVLQHTNIAVIWRAVETISRYDRVTPP